MSPSFKLDSETITELLFSTLTVERWIQLLAVLFLTVTAVQVFFHKQKQREELSQLPKLDPFHIATPLIESTWLSKRVGTQVCLKMDALQPSGSFKIRGIGHLIQRVVAGLVDPPDTKVDNTKIRAQDETDPIYDDAPRTDASRGSSRSVSSARSTQITHLVSSSGANAGMAVAHVAHKMNLQCSIFMSDTRQDRSNLLIPQFEALGCNVVFVGANWNECDAEARSFAATHAEAAYIPMFDHECIFRGHSTIVTELKGVDKYQPDCIVVATGGGGLLSGIALGLLQVGWQHDVTIVAAQGENCNLFKSGVENGNEPIGVRTIDSEGHDLGVRAICGKAMFWAERFSFFNNDIVSIVVKDDLVLQMCWEFADQHHVLIEPLCATAIAAVYSNTEFFKRFERICIVVCGGNHCSVESLNKWKHRIDTLRSNAKLEQIEKNGIGGLNVLRKESSEDETLRESDDSGRDSVALSDA